MMRGSFSCIVTAGVSATDFTSFKACYSAGSVCLVCYENILKDKRIMTRPFLYRLMEVGCFKIENGRLKKTGRIELSSLPLDVAIVDDDVVVLQKSKKDILTHFRADNGGQVRFFNFIFLELDICN